LRDVLPGWVRYVHLPYPAMAPYCRSWGLNVGARHCVGEILVLHDNDMLVPNDYAAQIASRVQMGYEAVNLKRFVFYLGEEHTRLLLKGEATPSDRPPVAIVQNLEAGGSVGITRHAFESIGGMDESFIGWGGEDNEFWDRAQTLNVWPYGSFPIVHLWHSAQPEKSLRERPMTNRFELLAKLPATQRIKNLHLTAWGQMSGPADIASDPLCAA
jgi:hypothetical protein